MKATLKVTIEQEVEIRFHSLTIEPWAVVCGSSVLAIVSSEGNANVVADAIRARCGWTSQASASAKVGVVKLPQHSLDSLRGL